MKQYLIPLLVLVALAAAFGWWTLSPIFITKEVHDEVPESAAMSSGTAKVVDTPAHPASGDVRLIEEADGTRYVRYENYTTLNGPDLFVYLSKDTEASDVINLGRVRGTEGNISYRIPDGVNLAEYPYVLTWCRAFGVLFNYADLSTISMPTKNNDVCIQVITPARNPDTGEIQEFPTPCDVPEGWEPVQNDIPGLDLI